MKKVNNFDVLIRMVNTSDPACEMAPLDNITHARATKLGTQITIGVSGNRCAAILNNQYVGGLFLIDKKRFAEVKAEMEKELNPE